MPSKSKWLIGSPAHQAASCYLAFLLSPMAPTQGTPPLANGVTVGYRSDCSEKAVDELGGEKNAPALFRPWMFPAILEPSGEGPAPCRGRIRCTGGFHLKRWARAR